MNAPYEARQLKRERATKAAMQASLALVLIPEGLYEAELIDVRRFDNAFGERAGLVFAIVPGRAREPS